MRFVRTPVLLSLAFLGSACSPSASCLEYFTPAVTVTVKDAQGNILRDARVAYSLDGAALTDASCFPPDMGGGGGCAEWATPDQPGDFLIRATSADGSRFTEQRTQVSGDECHADPQTMTLILQ